MQFEIELMYRSNYFAFEQESYIIIIIIVILCVEFLNVTIRRGNYNNNNVCIIFQ